MKPKVNHPEIYAILAFVFFLTIILSFYKSNILTPLASSQSINSNTDQPKVITKETKTVSKPINILLLGLDGRRGDRNPRCDAIHMISYNESNKTIKIITVPRGTEVPVPDKKNEYTYLSNSCHTFGIDFAVTQIQRITGYKNDYLVRLGFSQTLGALRLINLPASPLLKYLRNRSLPLGDYQRSHNQALFLKDLITSHFDKITSAPKSVLYFLYKLVDTDMDFDTAYNLVTTVSRSQIHKDPQNIILITKPALQSNIREMHFSDEEGKESLLTDSEFKAYQKDMEEYLDGLIKKSDFNSIKTPFDQRIWEQIESDKRHKYHYDLLRIYVTSSKQQENLPTLVLDYIAEMDALNEKGWKKKGEELLDAIGK